MSHEFNHDPEVIELRQTFGDWMGFVWQEMLSLADRNDGEIRGGVEWIARSLTWLWLSNSKRYNTEWRQNKIRMALEWMSNKNWIRIESGSIQIVNHAKYHKKREPNKSPSEPSEPSEPSLKNQDAPNRAIPKKDQPEWKEIADKIYSSDPKRFVRLMQLINWAAKENYSEAIIKAGLEKLCRGIQGNNIQNWWPYARKCLEKAYTEDQQAQSTIYSRETKAFLGSIVRAVGKA